MGVKQIVDVIGGNITKKGLLLSVLVFVFSITLSIINSTSTFAACPPGQVAGVSGTPQGDPKKCYAPGNPNPVGDNTDPATTGGNTNDNVGGTAGESDTEEVTCSIEKLGWLLCPVIETSGKIGDKAFQFLATTFLETEPELVSDDPSGTKYAWELARNLANIMFIIVFLIIIYSQVTGAGINNYGIKKMMPRLVVAALAVNVSYYICQLMVDLSNVMGYEIQNFMVDTAKQISDRAAMPPAGSLILGNDSPGVLEEIVMAVLAGATIVWMLLPFVFVGVGTIVITCLIILVILLLRKAFIVLLIVASPIAFVLYLLPNTEKYFQKWLSMFWKLLMVFPVVGILMGGGQLASAIILAAGSNGTSSIYSTKNGDEEKCIQLPVYKERPSGSGLSGWWSNSGIKTEPLPPGDDETRIGPCDSNSSTPLLLGLVAAGIAVAPLLAVFSVLKGALNAAGAIGGKIAGAVDTYTRKGADWGSKNTAIGRGMAARQAIKQNYKDQRFAGRMAGGKGFRSRYTQIAARGVTGNLGALANKADVGAINKVTGGLRAQDSKLSANFAGAADKIEAQETSEREAALNRQTMGDMSQVQKALTDAVERGDEMGAKAAQNLLFKMGGAGVDSFTKGLESLGNKASKEIIESLQANTRLHHGNIKSTSAGVSYWANDAGAGASLGESMRNAKAYENLSAEQFASQSGHTLESVQSAMKSSLDTMASNPKGSDDWEAARKSAQGIVNAANAAKNSKAYEGVKVNNKTVIEGLSQGKYS